jgi:hypothetical protein
MPIMIQAIFERYEKKYVLTKAQYTSLMPALDKHMAADNFDRYRINSIYYDTERYDIARVSIKKPAYKEKLRLRWYGADDAGLPASGAPIFLELKKKYKGRGYKYRIPVSCADADEFPNKILWECDSGLIAHDISRFLLMYNVAPKAYIGCDRIALAGIIETGLRVTFDSNIRFREPPCFPKGSGRGSYILDPENVLMEIKAQGAIPLWLCRLLSVHNLFPASFSKYGIAYTNFIMPRFLQICGTERRSA